MMYKIQFCDKKTNKLTNTNNKKKVQYIYT